MRRVLIVEDDPDMRRLLELYIEPLGFEVIQAVDGLEALYQAQYYEPDLVILDLMMPVASGDLVLGFIRSTEKLKKIPVLVVSAHANIAALAEQYEADAYLQKPFSPQDLRFVMQQFLTKE
ncbi:MAG: response regulator [Anaerolineae bacterium]|jgi:CheY-like chemotaxis protein|nr:MAG: response regulator [Anaerolineae bacterium]MCL4879575.1 response regulator [Anaerolineae bacterium]